MNNFIDHEKFIAMLGNKKRFPILILDEIWLSKFPKNHKNINIKKSEKDLKNYMKKEAKYTNDLKALKSLKNKYLKNILELTGGENTEDDTLTLGMKDYHERILEINTQIEDAEGLLIATSEQITQSNYELIEETVLLCYNIMRKSESEIKTVEPKMENLTERLATLTENKIKLEQDRDNTFNLLHAIVGKEVMDFLDEHIERNN